MQDDGGGVWEYLFPDEKQSDANVTGTSFASKGKGKGKGKGIGIGKGKGKGSEVNDSGCNMTVSGEPHSWGWSAPMANQWPDPPVITLTSRRGGEALPGESFSDSRPDGCEPEAGGRAQSSTGLNEVEMTCNDSSARDKVKKSAEGSIGSE